MVPPLTGPDGRLRNWRPRTPALPYELARLVKPDDPDWFAREMAIAAASPWWFWTFMVRRFSWLVSILGRVQVTVIAVAVRRLRVVPRIMATAGIISAPVAGPLLERTRAIRVERGTEPARHAVRIAEVALVQGGHVVAYPEGRVGLAATAGPSAAAPAWRGWPSASVSR